jgi:hypothetical protein
MEDVPKENPLNQPIVSNRISKEQTKHITDKGGIAADPKKLKTPPFMIKHQNNPNSLPEQENLKILEKIKHPKRLLTGPHPVRTTLYTHPF